MSNARETAFCLQFHEHHSYFRKDFQMLLVVKICHNNTVKQLNFKNTRKRPLQPTYVGSLAKQMFMTAIHIFAILDFIKTNTVV